MLRRNSLAGTRGYVVCFQLYKIPAYREIEAGRESYAFSSVRN